jgi:hypothetical protein
MQHSLEEVYRWFREICCFHLQGSSCTFKIYKTKLFLKKENINIVYFFMTEAVEFSELP